MRGAIERRIPARHPGLGGCLIRTAFGVPAAWAGIILALTSIPGRQVPTVRFPHVDKLVHFTLYAVLGALLVRALRRAGRLTPAALALSLLGTAAFAAADEWHQRWVPGRTGDFADWSADLAGATLALLLVARLAPRPLTTS